MAKRAGWMFGADRGLSKIWIFLIVLVLAAGVFLLGKFGPIYTEKWDFQDFMESMMKNLYSTGVDGMYEGLDRYVEENKLPLHPDEDCNFNGDIGSPGTLVCKYDVKIQLPGYLYIYHVRAEAKVKKIPSVAN